MVERTGSTNADLLADRSAAEGDWLIAAVQDAGRGRQGRAWASAAGNFHGSTLVELRAGDPPPQTLSLLAGLAAAEAIDVGVPGQPLMLKWPNDLLLAGGKLAGILLERSGNRVVAGFGINLAHAPEVADRRSASLDGGISPEAFAPLLAGTFARLLRLWRQTSSDLLIQAWMARSHPLGTPLTVHAERDRSVSGRFDGLERDGALRLRGANGEVQLIRAGDVELPGL